MNITIKATTKNEELILNYLNNNASDMLKEKINTGKKTLQQCWKYITNEAKKLAINGCACIEDKTVFGWAIHFFEEDSIKGDKIKEAPLVKTVKADDPKPKEKPKKEIKQEFEQLNLFDLLG